MNRIAHPTKTYGIPAMMALITLLIGWLAYTSPAPAATLLPTAEQTFFDSNGNPLAAGKVYFYTPSTLTPKDTWQNSAGSVLNANPVVLDSAGRAIIYGSGSYRQIVKDSLGNTIWDQVTADTASTTSIAWGGTSSGSANVQTVVASAFTATAGNKLLFIAGFSNTSSLTVNPNASGALAVLKNTTSGPAALVGGEVTSGNLIELDYDGTQFVIIDPAETPIAGAITNLASATTTSLGTITSHNAFITGTVTITSFGSAADVSYPLYFVRFQGALTLTHNGTSLIIPGGLNITTTVGDNALMEYLGSGNWRVRGYNYANPPWVPQPQGRLTLTTGVPVMIADVTTTSLVYYTPYVGNQLPIYNGTTFTPQTFSEMTLTLNNPNHVINSNYDVFAAQNAAVTTICTGPAWTSDTGRGTGAATTQLSRVLGLWTNTVSMTCRNNATTFTVAAGYGTYLGTLRTTGTVADTIWTAAPAAAAGGGNSRLYLWNAYNRVPTTASSKDSTDTWSYATATWRSADNNVANRITGVFGLNEDAVSVRYNAAMILSGSTAATGVGLDVTNAYTGTTGAMTNASTPSGLSTQMSSYDGQPGLGLHFFQAVEIGITNTTSFHGDGGLPLNEQSTLILQGRF